VQHRKINYVPSFRKLVVNKFSFFSVCMHFYTSCRSHFRFRRSLKTFLFRQSDHGALWPFLF